jgi:signal transduction histidine kinase
VKGPTGSEVLGWSVLEREGEPHVYGYRLDRTAFRRGLSAEAGAVADSYGARVEIGLEPPVASGATLVEGFLEHETNLGAELASIPVRLRTAEPPGPARLRTVLLGMSILLGVALLTGLLLSVRAVRREWDAARLRRDFVDNVSHELRTPLTSIRMYAEMLAEEPDLPVETRERYAGWILSESERLSRLVEDVLDLSRLSRGEPVLRPRETAPADLVRRVRALWEPLAREQGFSIRTEVGKDLPAVLADPDAAHRILANLVENAVRYSGRSREVGIVGTRDGDRVLLTVWDRGPGIAEDARPHLFTRFFRSPRDARRTKGAGLGLVLAREIARAQGGDVFLEASSPEGSRFTLALPAAGDSALALPAAGDSALALPAAGDSALPLPAAGDSARKERRQGPVEEDAP